MNYMPKVLEMLGVEVNETFKIKGFNLNPYQFDEEYNLIDKEITPEIKQRILQEMKGNYEND